MWYPTVLWSVMTGRDTHVWRKTDSFMNQFVTNETSWIPALDTIRRQLKGHGLKGNRFLKRARYLTVNLQSHLIESTWRMLHRICPQGLWVHFYATWTSVITRIKFNKISNLYLFSIDYVEESNIKRNLMAANYGEAHVGLAQYFSHCRLEKRARKSTSRAE